MTSHDCMYASVDYGLKDAAAGRMPGIHGKRIGGGADMLVAVVKPVAGEMPGCGTKAILLHASDKVLSKANHSLWAVAEPSGVYRRAMGMSLQVDDWGKTP